MTSAIAARVNALSRTLSLTHDEVGKLLNASPRAVSRWRKGESVPQKLTKQRLLELVYVGEQLSKVLRTEDANLWIFSPNELLGGDTPAQRLEQGDFRSVLAVIDALAEGVVT